MLLQDVLLSSSSWLFTGEFLIIHYFIVIVFHQKFKKIFLKIRTGEVLPLPITSLLPVILFPLLGIISTNKIAQVYMKVTLTKESSKITRLIVDRDQPWTVIKL